MKRKEWPTKMVGTPSGLETLLTGRMNIVVFKMKMKHLREQFDKDLQHVIDHIEEEDNVPGDTTDWFARETDKTTFTNPGLIRHYRRMMARTNVTLEDFESDPQMAIYHTDTLIRLYTTKKVSLKKLRTIIKELILTIS